MGINDRSEKESLYWSIDVPGMTKNQAMNLASIIRESNLNLEPLLINPANFFTLNLDRDTAEALRSGLLTIPPNFISSGLKEAVEEWLAWISERPANLIEDDDFEAP